MVCHSRAAAFVLGLCTNQMNRQHDYGAGPENQVAALMGAGLLRVNGLDHLRLFERRCNMLLDLARTLMPPIPGKYRDRATNTVRTWVQARWQSAQLVLEKLLEKPSVLSGRLPRLVESYPRLADPYDRAHDLSARARSYLHVNCAHCHVEAGGGNAAINLHFNTTRDRMRLFDLKPMHDAFGLRDARLVASGAPERSVLLHRVGIRGRGQMPPVGSNVVDEEALWLLREWVAGLKVE
jgi:hypothetical protein